MTPDDFDELLDAFGEAAPCDDADAAAARILEAHMPVPRRTSWWPALLASGLAAAAGVALYFAPGPAPAPQPEPTVVARADAPQAPVAPAPTATPSAAPLTAPPKARATPLVQPVATPTPPAVTTPVVTPEPEATPQPLVRPGLASVNQAVGHISGGAAHLVRGVLRYHHDATVDPGVEQVRLDALELVFTPVGTAFTVAAEPGLGAIVVTDGTVLVDRAGERIAHLRPGDGLLFATVDATVQHRQLKGPVDAVVAGLGLPAADADDARNLIVQLRLATRDTSALEPR